MFANQGSALRVVPARSRHLGLLELGDGYYAGNWFLDHVNNDSFNRMARWLHSLFFFPRSFLRVRDVWAWLWQSSALFLLLAASRLCVSYRVQPSFLCEVLHAYSIAPLLASSPLP